MLKSLYVVVQVETILLSSEDPEVLAIDRSQYENEGWRFILNHGDVGRNTGSVMHQINHQDEVPLDAVFLSALSTLHFMMRSKYLLLNCASNFHLHAKFLVQHVGCSLVQKPVIICLNEQVCGGGGGVMVRLH